MKHKVLFLLFGFFSSFFASVVFAQDVRFPFQIVEIEKYYDNSGYVNYEKDNPSFSLDNYAFVGKKANSTSTKNTFRLICAFNISDIVDNATITSAKLYWKGVSYSVESVSTIDIQIKEFPSTSISSFAEAQWSAIDNADELQTEGVPNYNEVFVGEIPLNSDFLTYIKNSLSSDILYLSFRGVDESNFGTNLNTHYCDFKTSSNASVEEGIGIKITFTVPVTTVNLTAKNDMNGWNGGNIGVGINTSATSKPSPYPINNVNIGNIINLQAYENQSYSGYNWIWNDTEAPNEKSEWRREIGGNSTPISNNQSTPYTVASNDNGANLIGKLKKVCNLTFTNSFNGISTTGSIKVNGTTVSAPTAQYSVVEGNTIQVEAIPQTYNDIKYTFSHWSDNNSTTNPRTITASSHANFTAVYVGTAIFTNYGINNRNLHSNTYIQGQQQFVTLYWNLHQSPNVTQYKVRRGANINGTTTWSIIATLGGTTTSYVDNTFDLASSKYTGSIIMYDVKAYYSPDQTLSANESITVYGNYAEVNKAIVGDSILIEMPAIDDFALESNYPNPFNPTTQISYQLPENSFVNLVVYNVIGQKVAELVNQEQTSGKYTVKFDASNLPSGVYIYKLQAGEFSDVKKMLLTK